MKTPVSRPTLLALLALSTLALLGCGGIVVLSGIFLRKQVLKINLLMQYIVLPALILKAFLAWQA